MLDAHPPLLPARPGRAILALLSIPDHAIASILAGAQIRRHDHGPHRADPID